MAHQFVKVTNITWKNDPSGRGFDCYLNNHLITPKNYVTIKFDELPRNWVDLQKMLQFEMFAIEDTSVAQQAPPSEARFTAEDVRALLQEALKGMVVPAGTPQPQGEVVNVPQAKPISKPLPPPMFIPDQVASVDSADIQIKSETQKGESIASLKDKLKLRKP